MIRDGGSLRQVTPVLLAATLLALALRLYQLMRPGFLHGVSEYDDGVYFGAAVRLVHGGIPYRDFVLVQPPGIAVLMAPLAFLAKATGTAGAFAVARVLTACAGAAAVPVAGLLVRHRGPLAVAIAAGLLAVYPSGINAAHTVLLEPWVVLLCLLGAVAAFDGDQLAENPRRLLLAGAAFGFAVATKLWAILPALVIALLCLRSVSWRGLRPYLAGVAGAAGAVMLPFFALAPGAMYRDIVVAQVSRVDVTRVSLWTRLQSLAGLSVLRPASHGAIVLVAAALALVAVGCALVAWLLTRRPPPSLEVFAGLSAATILVAFLWPPDYYPHYAWFFAPFLAMALALPAARLVEGIGATRGRAAVWMISGLTLGVAATAAVAGAHQFNQIGGLRSGNPAPMVRRNTPAGACVVADIPAVTILADRFVSTASGCSEMVDPIGNSYALSHGRNGVTGAGRTPSVLATWLSAFRVAQYVWLQCPPWTRPQCLTSRRVPWSPALRMYFSRHFVAVHGQGRVPNLFVRRAPRLSQVALRRVATTSASSSPPARTNPRIGHTPGSRAHVAGWPRGV